MSKIIKRNDTICTPVKRCIKGVCKPVTINTKYTSLPVKKIKKLKEEVDSEYDSDDDSEDDSEYDSEDDSEDDSDDDPDDDSDDDIFDYDSDDE
jgi:hypothetical protein